MDILQLEENIVYKVLSKWLYLALSRIPVSYQQALFARWGLYPAGCKYQLKYTAKQEHGLVPWAVIGGGIREGTSATYFLCSVLLVVLYKYQL